MNNLVSRLSRPSLTSSYRRLEWYCECGMLLYGDFQGDEAQVDTLVIQL